MKRLFLLLLCVIMLVPTMNACSFDKPSDGTVDSSESLETGAFSVASLADYTVVYSKNEDSGRVHKGIRNLCAALSDKFGVEVEHRNDRVVEDAATADETCEILVGQTNREASKTVYADLKKVNDYEIRIIDQKVVIAAWDEEIMVRLLQELCDTVNDFSEDRSHFFDSSMQQVGKGTYELENICLGSDGINDYTVVYENTDMGKYMAERITQKVMEKTGYILKTASDPDMVQGKMILVGNTFKGKPADMDLESNEGYYAGLQGDDLYLFGEDDPQIYKAVEYFLDLLDDAKGDVAVIDPDVGAVISQDTSITSMSFNLWVGGMTDARMAVVLKMIQKHCPDTFGVQEASSKWMDYLNANLGDEYAFVGEGREGGSSGERSAVFYKKDRFALIESGTQWLSDTPDQPSKYSNSMYKRIFTYALLERKSDGLRFMHINTHTDHAGNETVRLQQVSVITDFIKKHTDVPTVISGDFNAQPTSASILHMCSVAKNSSEIALVGKKQATFQSGSIIDYIFVTHGDFLVYRYQVDPSKIDHIQPSDHYPVVIRFDINNSD